MFVAHLDLVYICLDASYPTCSACSPLGIHHRHASVLETPNYDLQTLRYVAFDKSRDAFPSNPYQFVCGEILR